MVDVAARPATGRVVVAIGALGAVLRVVPLVGRHGVLGFPADYDEGVYFGAGAALWRGASPYADFVLAHPPGGPLSLGWLSFVGDPSTAFALTRLASVAIGLGTLALVTVLAGRFGTVAAVAAALVYAAYPEAVQAERMVLLEPLLNLLAVAGVAAWVGSVGRPGRSVRWAATAGVLLGLAVTVKLWAAFAVLACVVGAPPRSRRHLWALAAGAAGAVGAVVAPFVAIAGTRAWDQVVALQSRRPPAGGSLGDRAESIFAGHSGVTLLVIVAVMALVVRRDRGLALVAAVWHGLLLVAFLAAPSYFDHYAAHLAPSAALLAGYAAARATAVIRDPGWARRVVGAAVGATVAIGVVVTVLDVGDRGDDLAEVQQVLASVPADACVLAFEPVWLVAADRLPYGSSGAQLAVDPYGAMLLAATANERFGGEQEAFAHPAARAAFDAVAARCDHVLVGARGRARLGRLAETHERLAATTGGVELWRRRP